MPDLTGLVIIVILVVILAFYVWYGSKVFWNKPVTGAESLIGAKGVVYSETLSRDGEVRVNGVIWKARLAKLNVPPLKKGDEVTISGVENLTLIVERAPLLAKSP